MKIVERQACKWTLSRHMSIEALCMMKPRFIKINTLVLVLKTDFPSVNIHIWRHILSPFELQVWMSQNVTMLSSACMIQASMFKTLVCYWIYPRNRLSKMSKWVSSNEVMLLSSVACTSINNHLFTLQCQQIV